MDDRLSDLHVWIERHIAGMVVDQSGWQGATELAAPCLIENAAPRPSLDPSNSALPMVPLRPDRGRALELAGSVEAVLVENQVSGKGPNPSKPLPAALVAC